MCQSSILSFRVGLYFFCLLSICACFGAPSYVLGRPVNLGVFNNASTWQRPRLSDVATVHITFYNYLPNTTCFLEGCRSEGVWVNEDDVSAYVLEGENQLFVYEGDSASNSYFTSGNCTYACETYSCLCDFQWRKDAMAGHEFYGVSACQPQYHTYVAWPTTPSLPEQHDSNANSVSNVHIFAWN